MARITKRQMLIPALFYLFLGALSAVCVAWLLCLLTHSSFSAYVHFADSLYPGVARSSWSQYECPAELQSVNDEFPAHMAGMTLALQRYGYYCDRFGWPWLSMEANVWDRLDFWRSPIAPEGKVAGPPIVLRCNGVRLPTRLWMDYRGGPGMLLPTRPLWIGLAIDAAVYAVLWFAIVRALAYVRDWMRRHRRMRLGCCAHCGYDLKGNVSGVCPECGAEGVSTAV